MKKYRIHTTKDSKNQKKCLREISQDVSEINDEIKEIVERLVFYKGNYAIGLSAPQIGVNLNIIVVDDEGSKNIVLINPTWFPKDDKKSVDVEGCVSVPRQYFDVERYNNIVVKAIGMDGKPIAIDAEGLFARVIQHECDHLKGVMICDVGKPKN